MPLAIRCLRYNCIYVYVVSLSTYESQIVRVWCGVVWYGMVCCDVCGVVWCVCAMWCCVVCVCDVVCCGVCGVVWCVCVVWCGVVWCGVHAWM